MMRQITRYALSRCSVNTLNNTAPQSALLISATMLSM